MKTPQFRLGGTRDICRLGFGCMRLTGQPGNFGRYPDWEHAKAVLRRAAELGVNFFDTAHAYGPGHNEDLVADALYPYAPELVIASKAGIEKSSPTEVKLVGHPEALQARVEESLRRLKTNRLDLYYLHCPDPNVPIEESVGALEKQRSAGKIDLLGVCNVSLSELERAQSEAPIAAVQNRYNIEERESEAVVEYCREKGIAFVAYAPLGANPRAYGAPLAERPPSGKGKSAAQQAIRALLDHAPHVVAIPGTTSLRHLEENVESLL